MECWGTHILFWGLNTREAINESVGLVENPYLRNHYEGPPRWRTAYKPRSQAYVCLSKGEASRTPGTYLHEEVVLAVCDQILRRNCEKGLQYKTDVEVVSFGDMAVSQHEDPKGDSIWSSFFVGVASQVRSWRDAFVQRASDKVIDMAIVPTTPRMATPQPRRY